MAEHNDTKKWRPGFGGFCPIRIGFHFTFLLERCLMVVREMALSGQCCLKLGNLIILQ